MTNASATTLGRGFKWLLQRWYIPLTAVVAALIWLATRLIGMPRPSPRRAVADELDEIDRAERMYQFAVEHGAKLANDLIDQEYRDTLRNLDRKQRQLADNLRCNPGRRIRFLRRLSKRLERRAAGDVTARRGGGPVHR